MSRNCPKCKAQLPAVASLKFCPHCGNNISASTTTQPPALPRKAKTLRQKLGIGCLGFIVIFGLLVIFGGGSSPDYHNSSGVIPRNVTRAAAPNLPAPAQSSHPPATTPVATPMATPARRTLKEIVTDHVVKVMGAKRSDGKDRIVLVDFYNESSPSMIGINIRYRMDDMLTLGFTKSTMLNKAVATFRAIYTDPDCATIARIGLMPQFDLTDAYGRSSESTVARLFMNRITASKINWDQFQAENLKMVLPADGGIYWTHPAFEK